MDATREWYYADGTEAMGPFAPEYIRSLVQHGLLTADALVWRRGSVTWVPILSAFPEVALAVTPAVAPANPLEWPAAVLKVGSATPHAWRRFCARAVDFVVYGILLLLMLLALGMLDPKAWTQLENSDLRNVVVQAVVQAALFCTIGLSSGVHTALTGASLGKRMFGIRVVDARGKPPGIVVGMMREFNAMLFGFGMWLPLVSLVAFGFGVHQIMRPRALWDTHAETYAVFTPLSDGALMVRSLLFWGLLAAVMASSWSMQNAGELWPAA